MKLKKWVRDLLKIVSLVDVVFMMSINDIDFTLAGLLVMIGCPLVLMVNLYLSIVYGGLE